MKTSIIIPTYNEAENLPELVKAIDNVLEHSYEIIIVDDNSPDGTAATAKELQDPYPIIIIERDMKKGLGSAYKDGLDVVTGDRIIQMDADFSHSPEDIPALLDALTDADVAVGSRYVEGGTRNDPWYRQILPRIGAWLYTLLLGTTIRDITSGFKAYRSAAAQFIRQTPLPDGYSFQAASLYRLQADSYRVEEVPIHFAERRHGTTKHGIGELWENLTTFCTLLSSRFLGTTPAFSSD